MELTPPLIVATELTTLQRLADITIEDPDISFVEFKYTEGQTLVSAGDKTTVNPKQFIENTGYCKKSNEIIRSKVYFF